jgi:hypothetical protein
MPSRTYALFADAIRRRKPVLCVYDGHARALCPVILGHSGGKEKALTFQFAGDSSSDLPRGGEWRCLFIAKVTRAEFHDGPWIAGRGHTRPQGCVEKVDLDANPESPYGKSASTGANGRHRSGRKL